MPLGVCDVFVRGVVLETRGGGEAKGEGNVVYMYGWGSDGEQR